MFPPAGPFFNVFFDFLLFAFWFVVSSSVFNGLFQNRCFYNFVLCRIPSIGRCTMGGSMWNARLARKGFVFLNGCGKICWGGLFSEMRVACPLVWCRQIVGHRIHSTRPRAVDAHQPTTMHNSGASLPPRLHPPTIHPIHPHFAMAVFSTTGHRTDESFLSTLPFFNWFGFRNVVRAMSASDRLHCLHRHCA